MINQRSKQARTFFSSLTYSKPPNLSTQSHPQFSFSICFSIVYYAFILFVLYNQMFLLFEKAPVSQLIHQKEISPILINTGQDINITLKYSLIPQKLSKQLIQSMCSRVQISNSQSPVRFKTSTFGDCFIQSQKQIQLNEIILYTNDLLFDIPIQVSFKKSNEKNQVILVNISKNRDSLNILNIIIDPSIQFVQNDIFSFEIQETKIGLNKSPQYQMIAIQNTTALNHKILQISSSKMSHTKFSSQFKIIDLISNISTIVLLIYFSSLFLFFEFLNKNSYLQLASRLFILKYNNNNQLVYQNINPSVCQNINCSKSLDEDLKNKAIQRVIEKLDISNMIKSLKNLEILVNQNQTKIYIHNMKKTITTMNPYDLRQIQKQKILEYMQLQDIKIDETKSDIFSSPLMVSIAHKLTCRQTSNFLDNFSQVKQQKQINLEQLIIQIPKEQNIVIKTFKIIGFVLNKILEQIDIFTYRVGFFFDEHSQSLLSSFTGLFTSIKIWLFIMLCYSTISSFLSYQPSQIISEIYYKNQFDHTFSQPLYLFVHNTTSGEYFSPSQINNIAAISYNIQNKSYILSPINKKTNNLQNTQWKNRDGGVFQFDSKLNSKNNTFSIQMQYVCSNNIDCEKQFLGLFLLDFYFVLPSVKMQGQNILQQQFIAYKFKYQSQNKKLQHILFVYEMSSHTYDRSIIPNNNNQKTTLQFKKDESKITYQQSQTAITIIDFKLSNKIISRRSTIMQIDQFIGFLGAIWIILGGLVNILQQFIKKVQEQISLKNEKVSWSKVIQFIFIRIFSKNNEISKIMQQGKQLYSLEKTIQRMSIIQNYIHTYQFFPYRTIFNIYTKTQLQPFYQKPKINQPFDFSDFSSVQIKHNSKIQNLVINHHPNNNSNNFMKFLFTNLNRINIFDFTPKICLKGKSKISSKTSKLLSIIILIIIGFLIISNIQCFGNNTIVQSQTATKISGMEKITSEQFELCINFESQSQELGSLIDDYLLLQLKQSQHSYNFIKSQNSSNYCIQQKFKKQQFKQSTPFIVSININSQKLSPNFQQYYSKILRHSEYSLCMTNYYFSSSKKDSISSHLQCFKKLQLKSRVSQTTVVNLHWNIIQNSGFYNFLSSENKHKYELRDENFQQYQSENDIQLSTFQFVYTQGIQHVIVQESVMTLLKKILGLILIVLLLKPLITKYNQTKFILELSKQFFLVQGQKLQLTFYDVLKFIFLSVFKLKKFMTRRNRILMRSYLNTRKLLSYKDFMISLSTIETILKRQSDQSLQILLKTYIKQEIYLQQNIDEKSAKLKLSILHSLKSKHFGVYQKLINMGLNNNQIFILIGQLLKENNRKNQQLNKKLQQFQQYLCIQIS